MRNSSVSWSGGEAATTGAVAWFGIVLVCILLVAVVVSTSSGRSRSVDAHYGALPAGVVEIDASDYLVPNARPSEAHNICGGGGLYEDPQARSGAMYYSCEDNQVWNDHTRPLPGLDYFQAIGATTTSSAFLIAAGATLIAALFPGAVIGWRRRKSWLWSDEERERRERMAGLDV